jgi:hypothetical protein
LPREQNNTVALISNLPFIGSIGKMIQTENSYWRNKEAISDQIDF